MIISVTETQSESDYQTQIDQDSCGASRWAESPMPLISHVTREMTKANFAEF
jgi:hypothetical protein